MFSHLVTAAKGLFTRPDSDETSATSPSATVTPNRPNMVTATRQRNIAAEEAPGKSDINSTPVTNGKRKTRTANSAKAGGQQSKRRKRTSLEENGESRLDREESPKKVDTSVKKNHVKFGSEEPEEPVDMPVEEVPGPQQNGQDDGDESSDDDAPEAIDNSAQMSRLKAEAQKLQQAKQRFVFC